MSSGFCPFGRPVLSFHSSVFVGFRSSPTTLPFRCRGAFDSPDGGGFGTCVTDVHITAGFWLTMNWRIYIFINIMFFNED